RLSSARIQHRVARLQRTGIEADKAQLAERIVDQLECQCGKRLRIFRLAAQCNGRIVRIDALDRSNIDWTGQVIDDRIEQRLNAFVLECAAAEYRKNLHLQRRLADGSLQLFRSWRL